MSLDQLRAMLALATQGQWKAKAFHLTDADGMLIGEIECTSDTKVIAEAVNALPALLEVAQGVKDLGQLQCGSPTSRSAANVLYDPCGECPQCRLTRSLAKLELL